MSNPQKNPGGGKAIRGTNLMKKVQSNATTSTIVKIDLPSNSMLLGEEIRMFQPSLAARIGLERAIVLQQVVWLLRQGRGAVLNDGRRYVFNSYVEWKDSYFPFLTTRTLMRIFVELEMRGYLQSCQPEGVVSRRKYYTIGARIDELTLEDAGAVSAILSDHGLKNCRTCQIGGKVDGDHLSGADVEHANLAVTAESAQLASCQNGSIRNVPKKDIPLPKTSAKTSYNTKPQPPAASAAGVEDKSNDSKKSSGPESEPVVIPPEFDTEEFRKNWKFYLEVRKKIRFPLTNQGQNLCFKTLKRLAGTDIAMANLIVEQSIELSYRGLFPVKQSWLKSRQGGAPMR